MDQGGAGITSLPGSLALFSLNLLLLREAVSKLCLEASDSRSIHLRKVIRVKDGDFVDLAVRNGPKGKGKVFLREDGAIELELTWLPAHSNDLHPISLVVAQCRPQTCRKILDQATSLGVGSFSFFQAEKSEPSYAKSSLWQSDEWIRKIEGGVEQAFSSFVPRCDRFSDLKNALDNQSSETECQRIALDNYEASDPLSLKEVRSGRIFSLCLGPERGWSDGERKLLRSYGYSMRHLGERVLRVETAVVAALSLLASSFW